MAATRFQFEVLQGSHNEYGKTYGPKSIVNSRSDLRRHNKPGSQKFRFIGMVEEDAVEPDPEKGPSQVYPATPSDDTLSGMSIQELRKFAEQEEIELGTAKSKSEILVAIRAAIN